MICWICRGGFLDLAHRRHRAVGDLAAVLGLALRRLDGEAGLAGAGGRTVDGVGQVAERGGGLLQGRRLALGAARQVVGGGADLVRAALDPVGVVADHGHGRSQLAEGAVEVLAQGGVVAGEVVAQAHGQIALGQPGGDLGHGGDHAALHGRGLPGGGLALVALLLGGEPLGGGLRFQPVAVDGGVAEDGQGLGHLADFVAALGVGHRALLVARGQAGHAPGQGFDRLGDAGPEQAGADAGDQQQRQAERRQLDRLGGDHRIDVIDVDARADTQPQAGRAWT